MMINSGPYSFLYSFIHSTNGYDSIPDIGDSVDKEKKKTKSLIINWWQSR